MANSSSNSNYKVVPEATDALNKFKYEVASDMCVKNIFTYLLATSFLIYAIFFFIFFISFNSLNLK